MRAWFFLDSGLRARVFFQWLFSPVHLLVSINKQLEVGKEVAILLDYFLFSQGLKVLWVNLIFTVSIIGSYWPLAL